MKSVLRGLLFLIFIISLHSLSIAQSKVKRYVPQKDISPVRGQPYERYFTQVKFGRIITFYLSETSDVDFTLSLVVYIQDSGCNSALSCYH